MSQALPTHIGFIVDGNRRWARERGLSTYDGHKRGYEVLKEMAYVAQARGVKYVSAFVFSTENWQRSKEEVSYLMDLFLWAAAHDMKKMVRDGFRIVFIGRPEGLRAKIRAAIEKTEKDSASNTGTTLALCFNYGGQAEIVDAAKGLVSEKIRQICHSESTMSSSDLFRGSGVDSRNKSENDSLTKKLTDEITEETFAKYLWHPEIPPIDIMVRSSGEQRLSGFMLWRVAYAELMWIKKNWPDMTESDFDDVLAEFAGRQRRFGK